MKWIRNHISLSTISVLVGYALALSMGALGFPSQHLVVVKSANFAAIDGFMEKEMLAGRIPGVALAVVQGGHILYQRGYGSAGPDGRAITPQTPFILGSVSKSLTAMAVMQLLEQGRLDLNAPVQRYLPWFRVADAQASARITIRDLMAHTSGLPASAGTRFLDEDDASSKALERHVRALAATALDRPAGQGFEYSNANYTVLGLVIQVVSGEPYEQYIQGHIFSPLADTHSYTSQAAAQAGGMATGYRMWFGYPFPLDNPPFDRGDISAGYLISSAEDMGHYLIALLNGGRYGTSQLLDQQGLNQMMDPMVLAPGLGNYGLGWFSTNFNGMHVVWNGGDVSNFHSDVWMVPEKKLGVVVLVNANTSMNRPHIMALGPGVLSLAAGKAPPVAQITNTTKPNALLYVGMLGILMLQVASVGVWARTLHRWQLDLAARPRGWWLGLHVGGPLLLDLVVVLLYLIILPAAFGMPLPGIVLFQPDMGWTMITSIVFAVLWGALRSGWALKVLSGQPEPNVNL